MQGVGRSCRVEGILHSHRYLLRRAGREARGCDRCLCSLGLRTSSVLNCLVFLFILVGSVASGGFALHRARIVCFFLHLACVWTMRRCAHGGCLLCLLCLLFELLTLFALLRVFLPICLSICVSIVPARVCERLSVIVYCLFCVFQCAAATVDSFACSGQSARLVLDKVHDLCTALRCESRVQLWCGTTQLPLARPTCTLSKEV